MNCRILLSLVSLFAATSCFAEARPNILVILVDDLGYGDLSSYGAKDLQSPHIDKLLSQGMKFTEFYANCPVCSPTRAALLSGRYQDMVGVPGVIRTHPENSWGNLTEEATLLPKILKANGYNTACIGKWHLGLARKAYWPGSRGFDFYHGHLGGAIDYFTHAGYGTLDWFDNDEIPLNEEGYSTRLIGGRACAIIRDHDFSKQPLFLYVPFNAPHAPIQAEEKDIESYSEINGKRRRTYAAMVTAMDREIGRIEDALEEKGVTGNTLVFFSSDNGGHTSGASSGPLRGTKGTLYEGGIRVPAFMVWPGRLKSGSKCDEVIHVVDLFPTLTGLAGGDAKAGKPLDGVNVWPTVSKGRKIPKRSILHNLRDARGRGAIRKGPWKLVVSDVSKMEEGQGTPLGDSGLVAELFRIGEDPYERKNLAASHPEITAALWTELRSHKGELGDSRPYSAPASPDWQPPADWSQVPD